MALMKKKVFNPENKRAKEIQSFQEAFTEMLNAYKIKQKFEESNIVTKWEEIMGKTIAVRTSKIYIKEKKLFIEISSAPLKQQLMMSKSKILEILNRGHASPVINEVKFL
jgi:lysyl-tRNA synthetase class II